VPVSIFGRISHGVIKSQIAIQMLFNLGAGYDFTKKLQVSVNINNILDKYGVMSWSRPGTFLAALDREGYTKAMYQADVAANKPYSTIAIPPRAYFLTLTYKF